MMHESISFVVPVYNTGKYLFDCIQSIEAAAQAEPQYEIVLVDDASTDTETLTALGQLETHPKIRVSRLPRNEGPAAARNLGAEMASGDWLVFVDSDDQLQADSLQKRLHAKSLAPDINWISGDYAEEREVGKIICPGYYDAFRQSGQRLADGIYRLSKPLEVMAAAGTPPSPITTMVRRSQFLAVGGFPEDCRYGEDVYLSFKLARVTDLLWIEDILAINRRYHHSMMKDQAAIATQVVKAPLRAYRDPELKTIRRALRWRIASRYRWSSEAHMACGNRWAALKSAVSAIVWSPNDARSYRSLLDVFLLRPTATKN